MPKIIPPLEEITPQSFKETFHRILEVKKRAGLTPILDNPPDLFDRAKLYGIQYRNGSWNWASNIWSRSAKNTVVIERDEDLKEEHKLLLMRVLEHILAQGPLIKVDGYVGKPGTKAQMHARVYVDPQFPDLAYRWKQLVFEAPPDEDPDIEVFMIPHYLGNPNIPGTDRMLMVMRFPHHYFTVITVSSYQGEVKKAVLTHWIFHVYKRGGTGEHASLREFSVKTVEGEWKRIVMAVWGLTGTGKSTHGLYVWTPDNSKKYVEEFGINPLDYVKDQVIKNDDIVAIFEDRVIGSEKGSWTKTEDLTPEQEAMWKAAMSPHALHENTEFDGNGYPSFKGELFQYFGVLNKNSRSVLRLEDTGYFDGDVESSGPLNTAIFLSPGYFTEWAWMKIEDPALAAKALADGRTIGHPAQSREVVGRIRYVARFAQPFTMGVSNTDHVVRFYEYLKRRKERGDPIDVYLFNNTGRIIAKYRWTEVKLGDRVVEAPEPILVEKDGVPKAVGGERPTIEETELFILQAVRGAVRYKPHPVWGEKVLVPVEVPGIGEERLKQLDPTSYLDMSEFRRLLRAQIEVSKYWLDKNCPGLPREIYEAMDF
ncbi:MAG: phosphoenolpyruvate carboxykinase (ATP) [Candidatus Korarchaeota archaeon]|nr:phosphoenolpyruvate carboxykinase (ATP) [Candidatus Korarchaeota archaeon]